MPTPLLDPPPVDAVTASADPLPALGYLRALVTPGLACAFLCLRPSAGWALALWALLPFALDLLADSGAQETRQPAADAPSWPFEAILYAQFALHWTNLILAMQLVAEVGWASWQVPVALLYLLLANCLTGAVGGHEQVHSPIRHRHWMGRLLYCSFLHEHWCAEHLRGHHARFASREDPSTARLGESLVAYLWRTLPDQAGNAWRLERARLRRRPRLRRSTGNWVLQGLLIEALLLAAVVAGFGWAGLGVFLIQAAGVSVLLHVVNYFEHWGLDRRHGDSPGSWDSTCRSTLFSMVGLVRHADHHLHPARRYFRLRHLDASPKLPRGYAGMIFLAVARNRRFQELMRAELERKGLLPAAPPVG